jgi:UDP-3-O-[3-hydroxymyristoyl] N-acetylglucosamine deacetylase
MRTLKKEVNITGKALMSGKDCTVNIFPSQEKGIRFFVEGCKQPVLASTNSVVSTENCVVLANQEGAKVILVEHFMATCAFANINSLDVCLSSSEIPIFDGSSKKWLELFEEAGISSDNEEKFVEFKDAVYFIENQTALTVLPAEEFKITYCMNFNHPDLQNKWVSFDLAQNHNNIIEARTFGYLKDLEKFQQMGLALGVSIDNTVGLTEDGYTTELRSEHEPLKHKILDLIGDLSLTGLNPLKFKAHIIAINAGHKFHVELAKLLDKQLI